MNLEDFKKVAEIQTKLEYHDWKMVFKSDRIKLQNKNESYHYYTIEGLEKFVELLEDAPDDFKHYGLA